MIYDHLCDIFYSARLSELLANGPPDCTTREELADLLGVSQETINEMENGDYNPTLHMAYKLAAAFEIPLENLLADSATVHCGGSSGA